MAMEMMVMARPGTGTLGSGRRLVPCLFFFFADLGLVMGFLWVRGEGGVSVWTERVGRMCADVFWSFLGDFRNGRLRRPRLFLGR